MNADTRLIVACGMAAAMMFIGHWLPTAEAWVNPGVLRRLFAYIWGVGWILAGLWFATDTATAIIAATIAAAAGLATGCAYIFDWLVRKWGERRYGQQRP